MASAKTNGHDKEEAMGGLASLLYLAGGCATSVMGPMALSYWNQWNQNEKTESEMVAGPLLQVDACQGNRKILDNWVMHWPVPDASYAILCTLRGGYFCIDVESLHVWASEAQRPNLPRLLRRDCIKISAQDSDPTQAQASSDTHALDHNSHMTKDQVKKKVLLLALVHMLLLETEMVVASQEKSAPKPTAWQKQLVQVLLATGTEENSKRALSEIETCLKNATEEPTHEGNFHMTQDAFRAHCFGTPEAIRSIATLGMILDERVGRFHVCVVHASRCNEKRATDYSRPAACAGTWQTAFDMRYTFMPNSA